MAEDAQKLKTLFNDFKMNPCLTTIDEIIKLAKQSIMKVKTSDKNTAFSFEMAKSYYNWWVRTDPTPGYENRRNINEYFEQILGDITTLLKSEFTVEVKNLYLDLLVIYNDKIKTIYSLN